MRPVFVHRPEFDFTLPGFGAEALSSLQRFDGGRAGRAWALLDGESLPASARIQPERVSPETLARVHEADYLASLGNPATLARIIEIPEAADAPLELLERVLLEPMRHACEGTRLAVDAALEGGIAVHLSGGYHHAKRDRGEGFCVWSDLALGIDRARSHHGLERVMVVDLDAHQGNGVGAMFDGDEGVAVFDLYNADIWPWDEEARAGIRFEHRVASGTDGQTYLELLHRELPAALAEFAPQLVIFNAGTDVVAGDPLGELALPFEAVEARDRFVVERCAELAIPLVTLASGGYTEHSHRLLASLGSFVRDRWLTLAP
jgi:histone deacetylase 11